MAKAPTIGIDLGTTYSCVSIFQNGKPEIIINDKGHRITPSYVAFTKKERLIGDDAKKQIGGNPKNTVFGIKRIIGRKCNDLVIQKDIQDWPFVVKSIHEKLKVEVEYKGNVIQLFPEQISGMILKKMKDVAESYLGLPVTDAVITVPAYFSDSQRQSTIDAGRIAGLNVKRIINEPTAAALAFGLNKMGLSKVLIFDLGKILTIRLIELIYQFIFQLRFKIIGYFIFYFDSGGGTFDVSILTLDNGIFDVEAVGGDSHLGGEDFDNRLVNHFVQEFEKEHKIDLRSNDKAMQRLRKDCEEVKKTLSSALESKIYFEASECALDTSISRPQFEELCGDLFINTMEPLESTIANANLSANDIDDIILIGGSTRMAKIDNLLTSYFGKKPLKNVNPDEAGK